MRLLAPLLLVGLLTAPAVAADDDAPAPDEAGVCTDHLGGGILSIPDACRTLWTCLGGAEARSKEVGTPLGDVHLQSCIPGPNPGPVP